MPGSYDNDIAVLPLGYPMSVPLVVHVGQRVETHRLLVQNARLLEVDL